MENLYFGVPRNTLWQPSHSVSQPPGPWHTGCVSWWRRHGERALLLYLWKGRRGRGEERSFNICEAVVKLGPELSPVPPNWKLGIGVLDWGPKRPVLPAATEGCVAANWNGCCPPMTCPNIPPPPPPEGGCVDGGGCEWSQPLAGFKASYSPLQATSPHTTPPTSTGPRVGTILPRQSLPWPPLAPASTRGPLPPASGEKCCNDSWEDSSNGCREDSKTMKQLIMIPACKEKKSSNSRDY